MKFLQSLLVCVFWGVFANACVHGDQSSDDIFIARFNRVESSGQIGFGLKKLSSEDGGIWLRSLGFDPSIRGTKSTYLITSPEQSTGGYVFEYKHIEGRLFFCLRKPAKTDIVTQAKSHPAAVVLVPSNLVADKKITYCPD